MVAGILAYKFGVPFAWITSLSVATYVAYTLIVTQVFSSEFRFMYMLFLELSFSSIEYLVTIKMSTKT